MANTIESLESRLAKPENLRLRQIFTAFEAASNPEVAARLMYEQVKQDVLKSAFVESGLNFDLTPEDIASLRKKYFREMNTGRGVAVTKILGGAEVAASFEQYTDLICEKSRFKYKDDKARGLRQFVADLFEVALGQYDEGENHPKAVGKLNGRLLYSHARHKKIATDQLLTTFIRKNIPESDIATMPLDTPIKILTWLLSDDNERQKLLKEAQT